MIEIFKEFTFDAAHHIAPNVTADHRFARVHGHSFTVKVFLKGSVDPAKGWLMNLADVEKALHRAHTELDHHYLNEIEGLEIPTLENLALWIWNKLKPELPLLSKVTIFRGTLGEGCSYEG